MQLFNLRGEEIGLEGEEDEDEVLETRDREMSDEFN